ncbi:MAG: EAL domain-containing protein, partial [Pseudomonadota bacterium]
ERGERGTLYDVSHGAEQEGRESQLRRVREAIAMGAIIPFYQPVFDLRSGAIRSVEVLARLCEGDERIEASVLKPAFEDAELAPELGILVLDKLRADWRLLDGTTRASLPLSINVSRCELQSLPYLDALGGFLDFMEGIGASAVIEVSRNPRAILPSQVLPAFETLVDRGLMFSFDSLAAGFEALVEAYGLDVRQIKANKSTLTDPAVEERAAAIIGGMIATCRQLGVQLVATTIETEAELARLRDLGYTKGQGFYFSRPLSFAELQGALAAEAAAKPAKPDIAPSGITQRTGSAFG